MNRILKITSVFISSIVGGIVFVFLDFVAFWEYAQWVANQEKDFTGADAFLALAMLTSPVACVFGIFICGYLSYFLINPRLEDESQGQEE